MGLYQQRSKLRAAGRAPLWSRACEIILGGALLLAGQFLFCSQTSSLLLRDKSVPPLAPRYETASASSASSLRHVQENTPPAHELHTSPPARGDTDGAGALSDTVYTRDAADGAMPELRMGGSSVAAVRSVPGRLQLGKVIDLENVVLRDGSLHLYDSSPETVAALQGVDLRTCCLQASSLGMQGVALQTVFHDQPLDPTTTCNTTSSSIAFFWVPWQPENLFHLLHESLLPLADNVLTHPDCGGRLPCRQPSTLVAFDYTLTNPWAMPLPWVEAVHRLFHQTLPYGQLLAPDGQSHCLSRAVWGLGTKFFYGPGGNMEEIAAMVRATEAARQALLQAYGVPPAPAPPAGEANGGGLLLLKAVYVHRPSISAHGRFLQDPEVLLSAFRAMEAVREVVHFVPTSSLPLPDQLLVFRDADIVLGLHGAGLTNAVWAKQGVVVAEVKSDHGDVQCFRRTAQARRGGYVQLPIEGPKGKGKPHVVTEQQARAFAECAVSVARREAGSLEVCSGRGVGMHVDLVGTIGACTLDRAGKRCREWSSTDKK